MFLHDFNTTHIVHERFNVLPATLSYKLPRFIVISGSSVKKAVYPRNFTRHKASTKIKCGFYFCENFYLIVPFALPSKSSLYLITKHVCNKVFCKGVSFFVMMFPLFSLSCVF